MQKSCHANLNVELQIFIHIVNVVKDILHNAWNNALVNWIIKVTLQETNNRPWLQATDTFDQAESSTTCFVSLSQTLLDTKKTVRQLQLYMHSAVLFIILYSVDGAIVQVTIWLYLTQ